MLGDTGVTKASTFSFDLTFHSGLIPCVDAAATALSLVACLNEQGTWRRGSKVSTGFLPFVIKP